MSDVLMKLNEKGQGAFYFVDSGVRIGEMAFDIKGSNLTVYHTEVKPQAEGKGLARKLLLSMVDYARSNNLKVIALCPYVHLQFSRHTEEYADIWLGNTAKASE